jgi:hypothetical protein
VVFVNKKKIDMNLSFIWFLKVRPIFSLFIAIYFAGTNIISDTISHNAVVCHIIMNLSLTRTGCLSLELPIDGTHFTLVLKRLVPLKLV